MSSSLLFSFVLLPAITFGLAYQPILSRLSVALVSPYAKADIGRRAVAAGIDGGLVAATLVLYLNSEFLPYLLIGALYLLLRDAVAGRSVGKFLCGLVVIDLKTGRAGGRGASITRNALLLLPGANVVASFLEAVTIVRDPQGQRLGDRFAWTQVVEGFGARDVVGALQSWWLDFIGNLEGHPNRRRAPVRAPRRLQSLSAALCLLAFAWLGAAGPTVDITTPMPAPEWAKLQRRILADSAPAVRAFFTKYYDERGYFRHFVRWGANDGPDDAFENTAGWPELHALGASDEILQLHLKSFDGMIRQFTEAKTVDVPIGRQGMFYQDYSVQSDWMHHGEALRTFNVTALSAPALPAYQKRARTYASFYMGEDPAAPNYDPQRKIIRSMINGSRGPMLRKATSLDWVGDPFDVSKFVALHGEDTYEQFLAHYHEYTDVVGDHFLNLVATTLPLNAYLLDNEPKYRRWLVDYMDGWLARMKQNGGIIPSYVALDGSIGGAEGKWWNNAYGWGFSPVNPVTKLREDRNRIPRATVGFANALLVTGDQKYADAWRAMIDAVNSHARRVDGRTEYPSMYGDRGWYGWRPAPWNVGALELWYWSMKPEDRPRIGPNPWLDYLEGKNPGFPETVLKRDLDSIPRRIAEMQKDQMTPEARLADNAMEYNPAAVGSLVQLMWGALVPGREGSLLSARLRYFDPVRRRAGVPEDVGALVSELKDDRTVVTLVNLSPTNRRTMVVQGGGYGEHQIVSAEVNGKPTPINARDFTVQLAPGAGAKLTLVMKRYANQPTAKFPWDR